MPENRCASCSQHERIAQLEGTVRRSNDELCLALNGMHPEQGPIGGELTCPHGVTAKGMPPAAVVTAIRALCEQCRQDEMMSL